jgi:GTP:adenosylcobinamide-phosphate guanylyltransferase
VVKVLNTNCSKVVLKRFDEHQDVFQAIFLVEIDTIEDLERTKDELRGMNETVRVTYSENKGIS